MKHFFVAANAALLLSLPAAAHVTLEKPEATAGQTYKGVLRIGHGCDGSPTTSFSVDIPDGLALVRPMPKAGWQLTTETGAYSKSVTAHGKTYESGVTKITWSGGRLQDSEYDEFIFVGQLRNDVSGPLYLPVVQLCEKGEWRWVEKPQAGQSARAPAPVLRVAQAQTQSAMRVEQVWSRATPNGASVGAGYLRLTNTGSTPDKLIGGTSEIANRIEVHEMAMDNGVMKMRALSEGLTIKPGESVELKPGGYHLMIMGLKQPLKEGASFSATLTFEKAGNVPVSFGVVGMGAPAPAGGGKEMMDHSHHH
jgi:copper(I)-binding protein